MDQRFTLTVGRRCSNRRGAVLLLAVYFTSLILLILGGISLQRTVTETRSSQVSRDVQQAFYSAEGVMDYALEKAKRYYLDDGACYSAVPTAGRPSLCSAEEAANGPSFTLEPISAQIITQGKQEILTRQIIATGVGGAQTVRSTSVVSAYVEEKGPIEGAWGNRLVVAHGGHQFAPTFLSGSLRSNRGVLATIIADYNYDPASLMKMNMTSGKLMVLSGAAKAKDFGDLVEPKNQYISSELLTIKDDYMFAREVWKDYDGSMTYLGETFPGVKYVESAYQTSLPHVDGAGSLGIVPQPVELPKLPSDFIKNPSQDCKGDLALSDLVNPKHITDGFKEGDVHDLSGSNTDDFIVLCVNAVHPEGDMAWYQMYHDNPPALVFDKPALLYVIGSAPLKDPSDASLEAKTKGWNFSIGATISSAVDAAGKPIPHGLHVIVTEAPTATETGKHTIVWIKPGTFSGSVFAPNSLVLMKERFNEDGGGGSTKKQGDLDWIHLDHVVGDEVVIELNGDKVKLGSMEDDRRKPDGALTTYLGGWTNHATAAADTSALTNANNKTKKTK